MPIEHPPSVYTLPPHLQQDRQRHSGGDCEAPDVGGELRLRHLPPGRLPPPPEAAPLHQPARLRGRPADRHPGAALRQAGRGHEGAHRHVSSRNLVCIQRPSPACIPRIGKKRRLVSALCREEKKSWSLAERTDRGENIQLCTLGVLQRRESCTYDNFLQEASQRVAQKTPARTYMRTTCTQGGRQGGSRNGVRF